MTPLSIFARSTISSKPSKHTRNTATSKPVVPSKSFRKRPAHQSRTLPASDEHSSLVTAPISVAERSHITGVLDEERKSSEDSTSDVSLPQTPGPGFSVSQAPGTFSKRLRAKTSHIHEHISTRGGIFVCNRCSKAYKSSGGTGAIARHLKKAHFIDPTASDIAERRRQEGTTRDAAVLRGAEINIKVEETRREEPMGTGLDKTTLEYLYLKWITTPDIHFKPIRDPAFRTFLGYVNPVALRMLLELDSTVKTHAEGLTAKEKSGL